MGISHLYCSPYLQAAPGSTHGYDIVDYGWVNAELGGAAAHARLDAALKDRGLGRVLESGEIRLVRFGAVFQVHCPGQVLPVTPDSLDRLLQVAAGRSGSDELESIVGALWG